MKQIELTQTPHEDLSIYSETVWTLFVGFDPDDNEKIRRLHIAVLPGTCEDDIGKIFLLLSIIFYISDS